MAADKTPDQEPSIEEILASIRQIISDDDDKEGAAEEPVAAAAPEPAPAPKAPEPEPEPLAEEEPEEEEEDVLELTESMAAPTPVEPDPITIDLQDMAVEEPPAEVPDMPTPKKTVESEILTEAARASTISSMAKLAGNMPITRHREYGNITLEDLVREMLHPMLKDWLSDNLPPMVERMVQKELEKLARQAQDV
ncbi:MAG TPA: DUF2497 domain-containing protein [Micavibrio sp.]|nr:DUF2497 domain-containing protein [Micavibrio sp.]